MTADSVPAPMVQVPAETVEKLREAYNHRTAFAANVIAAARALVDAATPAASVPAADILALADHEKSLRELWREAAEKRIEQGVDWPRIVLTLFDDIDQLRALVAAAEQADKGEAADTPRVSHTNANVEGCVTCRNIQELGCMCGPNGCECPAPAAPPEPDEIPLLDDDTHPDDTPMSGEAAIQYAPAAPVGEPPRCPDCGHMPHDTLDFCPNMASDNDCDCKRRVPVNDEAEAAWQAWVQESKDRNYTVRDVFVDGYLQAKADASVESTITRAARGEDA